MESEQVFHMVANPVLTDLTGMYYFSQFELVSLFDRYHTPYAKWSSCPSDAVALSILKEGADIVSPSILSIINSL